MRLLELISHPVGFMLALTVAAWVLIVGAIVAIKNNFTEAG